MSVPDDIKVIAWRAENSGVGLLDEQKAAVSLHCLLHELG